MTNKIYSKLLENKDEKYLAFHKSLCPGTNNIIGVRSPIVKEIAKDIFNGVYGDYTLFLNENKKYYEEILLEGLVIGKIKDIDKTIYYLDKFIPKIYNWAVCDSTIASLKITKKNKEKMYEYIKKYMMSKNEFEVRFFLIMLLDYYIEAEYLSDIFKYLDEIYLDKYYVKMAKAWLISTAYIKYKEETLKYLKTCKLDDFTYNKSLQKIVESYRVSAEEKEHIKTLKRRDLK